MDEEKILNQKAEKKRIKDERKQLKAEQKAQRKEAKKRAKELTYQEAELEEEGSNIPIFLTTVAIVAIWLLIIGVLIKLDVGGFGSKVLTPMLKDVPVVNRILPNVTQVDENGEVIEEYGGYTSLREAVEEIKVLELRLEQAENQKATTEETMARLKEEVNRLKTFEDSQVEFERIKTEFYEEVIYADKGPGAEEYRKYYESMNPELADFLYKQVVAEQEASAEIKKYAQTYSEMKPKQAAAIFEAMDKDLNLVADILLEMEPDARGKIMGVMDPVIAAKLTKIMEPDS